MNKDQVKGVAKHIAGEIQEQVGKLTGDESTEARGHAREQEGKIQKNYGDAKELVKDKAQDLDRSIDRAIDRQRELDDDLDR